MTLEADLITMLNREISLDPSVDIDTDTDLLLTDLVDSLGVVEIVAWLEERLGIQIEPVDVVLENFQSVGQMMAYLARAHDVKGNA